MEETSTTSQNQKAEQSYEPGPLTQQEIEFLRTETKESYERIHELYLMKYGSKKIDD